MNKQEYFKKLNTMPEAAKVALIVTMLERLDDIIDTKGEKIMRTKAEALKESCDKIIDIAYQVSKED